MLARSLQGAGQVVRGTTRDPKREPVLTASGVEPFVGDPDRVGTLIPALVNVGGVCVLLGSAAGESERLAALHGPRLEMLLEKLIDTTVRGLVYEAAGTVPSSVLHHGTGLVREAADRSRLPYAVLDTDPADHHEWLESACAAVNRLALDS
jgi:uncharacterized protein YbjT (DUF2867 family)